MLLWQGLFFSPVSAAFNPLSVGERRQREKGKSPFTQILHCPILAAVPVSPEGPHVWVLLETLGDILHTWGKLCSQPHPQAPSQLSSQPEGEGQGVLTHQPPCWGSSKMARLRFY